MKLRDGTESGFRVREERGTYIWVRISLFKERGLGDVGGLRFIKGRTV